MLWLQLLCHVILYALLESLANSVRCSTVILTVVFVITKLEPNSVSIMKMDSMCT